MENKWHCSMGNVLGMPGVQVISGMARGIDGAGQKRCFERRRNNVCCSGMWSGCVLSKRKYRIIYGHSKKRRNHIGISTRNRTTCKKFSDAEPDYQWTGGMDTGDRGKRKERIFDHCRFCTGSGEGCLCTSRDR